MEPVQYSQINLSGRFLHPGMHHQRLVLFRHSLLPRIICFRLHERCQLPWFPRMLMYPPALLPFRLLVLQNYHSFRPFPPHLRKQQQLMLLFHLLLHPHFFLPLSFSTSRVLLPFSSHFHYPLLLLHLILRTGKVLPCPSSPLHNPLLLLHLILSTGKVLPWSSPLHNPLLLLHLILSRGKVLPCSSPFNYPLPLPHLVLSTGKGLPRSTTLHGQLNAPLHRMARCCFSHFHRLTLLPHCLPQQHRMAQRYYQETNSEVHF